MKKSAQNIIEIALILAVVAVITVVLSGKFNDLKMKLVERTKVQVVETAE